MMRTPVRALPALVSIMLCATLAGAAVSAADAPKSEPRSAKQNPPKELARQKVTPEIQERVHQMLVSGPLYFEVNAGQFDRQVRFLSRGRDRTLFLTATGAVLVLPGGRPGSHDLSNRTAFLKQGESQADSVARLNLVGANPAPQILGVDELPGRSNYFLGKDPGKWRTDIPLYARVHYEEVYPGVDLIYYGNEGRLEYDFVVAPGADPSAISLTFVSSPKAEKPSPASSPRLDSSGNLVLTTTAGDIQLHRPIIYQEHNGQKLPVAGRYELKGDGSFGFRLAKYDATQPLVIDPVLSFSSYLGGSGLDNTAAVAVDSSGNIYMAGQTNSSDFPTTSGVVQPLSGVGGASCSSPVRPDPCLDAFVSKLSPNGASLVYSTYLGGTSSDGALDLAVDGSGNAYLTGYTNSTDFPTTSANAFQGTLASTDGTLDAFVAKLDSSGSNLLYSSYLGGDDTDYASGLALGAGGVYITGYTASTDFPATSGTANAGTCTDGTNTFACGDVFVAEFNPTLSGLASRVYCTYVGGNGDDYGNSIDVDSSGNAYVAGFTVLNSSQAPNSFPMVGGFQTSSGGGNEDAFVAKLNSAGTLALLYSSFLGGSGNDEAWALALDSSNNMYVTGWTPSSNFPVTADARQSTLASGACSITTCNDAFVTKIDTNQSGLNSLVYSTYLGGGDDDRGTAIAVDSSGNVYVAGGTRSAPSNATPFPLVSPLQSTLTGDYDAFVSKLNSAGSLQTLSTYLGGTGFDSAFGVAVDASGNIVLAGRTGSADFPSSSGAVQPGSGGGYDAFVVKIDPSVQADFALANPSPPAAVNAGSSATFTVSVTPQGLSAQTVSLSCSTAPASSTMGCSVSPSSVAFNLMNSTTAQDVTVTVTTTRRSVAPPMSFKPKAPPAGLGHWVGFAWYLGLALFLLMAAAARRRPRLTLAAALLAVLLWASCGGGGGGGGVTPPPPPSGTPAGNYTVTVTGTSGSSSHSISVTLTVN
jgi:hypothetical protein